MNMPLLFAQNNVDVVVVPEMPWWYYVLSGIISIAMIVATWKVFEKAGEAGWKSIIPIYNIIVLLKIAGLPWWWIFLLLIPCVNFVVLFLFSKNLAEKFGQNIVFAIVLFLAAPIGYLILGFGDARYQGGTTPAKY